MEKKYTQFDVPGPEYRVRPVVRYVVTRYCHPYTHVDDGKEIPVNGGSEVVSEVPSEQRAFEIATALAKSEIDQQASVSV